jgi:transcriptional regulator with XRE-family HTH domain
MNYGTILAKLRKDIGYEQQEVANYISRHSVKPYSRAMISHWENGVSLPPVEQFLLMCELYKVNDIQKTFRGIETEIPDYNKLNSRGRSRTIEYISFLKRDSYFTEHEGLTVEEHKVKYLNLYDLPASAGTGNFLDGDSFELMERDETVPDNADLAIRISGNSMEPRFIDEQIVFVKKQNFLEVGEVGIFALDGEAYIKKRGLTELISFNPDYPPIPLNEFSNLHIFGKVVG